jgi:hypothetical protein
MQPQSNPFGASRQASRQDYQDYVERFQQGPQAVSEEEAASRYEQVAPNLPPDVYQQSAQEVFAQLTPEQRLQLGQALIQSARQQGQSFPGQRGRRRRPPTGPRLPGADGHSGATAAARAAKPAARRRQTRPQRWGTCG